MDMIELDYSRCDQLARHSWFCRRARRALPGKACRRHPAWRAAEARCKRRPRLRAGPARKADLLALKTTTLHFLHNLCRRFEKEKIRPIASPFSPLLYLRSSTVTRRQMRASQSGACGSSGTIIAPEVP